VNCRDVLGHVVRTRGAISTTMTVICGFLTVFKSVTIGVCENEVELYNNNFQRGVSVVRKIIPSNKADIYVYIIICTGVHIYDRYIYNVYRQIH